MTDDASQEEQPEPEEAPKRNPFVSVLREIGIILGLSLVIATIIRIFVVQAFLIPSGSMEETLLVGDRVAVSKFTTVFGDVERGDVVVFEDPGGWLEELPQSGPEGGPGKWLRDGLEFVGVLPNDAQGHLIKRVIGVGGDVVSCCGEDGVLTVNGEPIDESEYLHPGDTSSDQDFEVTVPEGEILVMGDHRSNSRDGRVNGTFSEDLVVGRAIAVIWPTARWTGIGSADAFDDVPDEPEPIESSDG